MLYNTRTPDASIFRTVVANRRFIYTLSENWRGKRYSEVTSSYASILAKDNDEAVVLFSHRTFLCRRHHLLR